MEMEPLDPVRLHAGGRLPLEQGIQDVAGIALVEDRRIQLVSEVSAE
jgi:hypothetical protein